MFIFLGLANIADVAGTTVGRLDGVLEDGRPEDLLSFYAAGRFVLEGRAGDIYDPDAIERYQEDLAGREVGGAEQGLPFFNPPFVAGLLAPFTALSLPAFSGIFFAVILGTVLLAGSALQRFVRIEGRGRRSLVWFGYLTFLPVTWLLMQQQLSMLVLLGWAGFAYFEMKGRHGLSGAALAIALVKPQSVVLILGLLLWKRRWPTLRAFTAAAAPLVLLSLLVSGPEAIVEYPRFLIESTRWEGRGVNAMGMFGWNGLAASLLGERAPPAWSYLPLTAVTLGALALVWRGSEWRPQSAEFGLLCGITLLTAMLTNPHFYLQDVSLLCLPLALAAGWHMRSGGSSGLLWEVVAVTWVVGMYGPQAQQDLHIPVFTPWMALLLLAAYALLLRSRRAAAAAADLPATPRAA
jgi:hypothetical protein